MGGPAFRPHDAAEHVDLPRGPPWSPAEWCRFVLGCPTERRSQFAFPDDGPSRQRRDERAEAVRIGRHERYLGGLGGIETSVAVSIPAPRWPSSSTKLKLDPRSCATPWQPMQPPML